MKEWKGDIVLRNKTIKKMVIKAMDDKEHSQTFLSTVSKEMGLKGMTKAALSRYLNNDEPVTGGLSQKHLLWVCEYYKIDVELIVKWQ